MSKSSRPVIISKDGIDILYAEKSYVVLYQGKSFSIRRPGDPTKKYYENVQWLYEKTTFVAESPAWHCATRLNEHFNTKDFTVNVVDTYLKVNKSDKLIKNQQGYLRFKETRNAKGFDKAGFDTTGYSETD